MHTSRYILPVRHSLLLYSFLTTRYSFYSSLLIFHSLLSLQGLILDKNTDRTESWLKPDNDTDTLLKAHIFNYTNIEDYLLGRADKMHVVDLGPLTYQEHTVKDEVSFNDNHTVTFRVSNNPR